MPIYEYQCRACGHHLDHLQNMNAPDLTLCPKCNQSDLQRLVSAASFQLKGDGWYVTDFRDKKSQGKDQGKDKDQAGKSDQKSESVATSQSNKESTSTKESSSSASTASTQDSKSDD